MPATSLFNHHSQEIDSSTNIGDDRTLQLALELSMLRLTTDHTVDPDPMGGDLSSFVVNPLINSLDEVRSKKSQNMTECVPVPSSEHVAEIVGRQGCKIKALRAKTNTYIKTPVRGEEPVFVVTGRKEDVTKAKREILSAADHFSQIRASRKNNLAGLGSGASTPPGPPASVPGHMTIQVRVPYRVVGLVVGPKGATIKRIQHLTHTYIVTPSRDKEPIFEVTGLPENVEAARREIESHIAVRTGTAAPLAGHPNASPFDDGDLIANLYKNGLSSLLNCIDSMQPDQMMSTALINNASSASSSGNFSSSSVSSCSSTSGGRDLGTIWGSTDRDEGLGDSPSFDTLSSIWSYPTTVSRPSPTSSTSPTLPAIESTSSAAIGTKCLVCHDARVTHALLPCGHNFFCVTCAQRVCDSVDALCPRCSQRATTNIRIFSPNP